MESKTIRSFLLLPFLAATAVAQDAPVSLTNIVRNGLNLEVEMKNTSSKPVVGYSVRARCYDSAQKQILVADFLNVTNAIIPSTKRGPFVPGETWKLNRDLPSSTPGAPEISEVKLSLDVVIFADGTKWGPNSARNAERISGMAAGALWERQEQQSAARK